MSDMAEWYADQAEGEHEDRVNGTGKFDEDDAPAVIILEEVDEFADVPQGKPEGVRLGGDAPRRQVKCPTCKGAGRYEITVFGPPDANDERHPEQRMQACVTCYSTGMVEEVAR